MKLNWEIVHDCDDDEENPTCWCIEINHYKYGKYVWISQYDNGFNVEVDRGEFEVLKPCKSLTSAKRWVSINLL